jgi:ribonuclease P protein component
MLNGRNRLRSSKDFGAVVRQGRRCGRSTLVVHLLGAGQQGPPRVGFVVSKAVGGAVVRNTVTRRLRAAVRDHLSQLPPGSLVVIRALPPAATAGYTELVADLEGALERLERRPLVEQGR